MVITVQQIDYQNAKNILKREQSKLTRLELKKKSDIYHYGIEKFSTYHVRRYR